MTVASPFAEPEWDEFLTAAKSIGSANPRDTKNEVVTTARVDPINATPRARCLTAVGIFID
jgi:hypothetical protein